MTTNDNEGQGNETQNDPVTPAKKAAAVAKKAPASASKLSKQDKPAVVEEDNGNPQFYVHLANGEVKRCEEEDLPQSGGSNAPHGFWVENGKAHYVTGVFPAETEVK